MASSRSLLPVVTRITARTSENTANGFNFKEYFATLKSTRLGSHVVYQHTMPSTQSTIEQFTNLDGAVAIAREQTEGKGRSGNVWTSPPGCAMFSVHVKVNLSSPLGRHLGFVQHLAALAMLQAIKTHSTCSHLDIRLKWPNDIYYCKRIKLAGLVVQSTMLGQTVHCFIGCGMNVSNSSPTTCLNDIIRNVSSENGAKATEFTVESVIAETLNQLDDLLVKFDQNGVSWAKDAYKASWMHNNQDVKLANGQDVVVDGVDDQGFLTVVNKETGQETTVCPDGNRFDMMSNMIVLKH